MEKQVQEKVSVCPVCGRKVVAVATEDGIYRLVCGKCRIIASSIMRKKGRIDIRVTSLNNN